MMRVSHPTDFRRNALHLSILIILMLFLSSHVSASEPLTINKDSLELGEQILIHVNIPLRDASIVILSPLSAYEMVDMDSSVIPFFPRYEGHYTVLLKENGRNIYSRGFTVGRVERKQVNVSVRFIVKDKYGFIRNTMMRVFRRRSGGSSSYVSSARGFARAMSLSPGKYDVELSPEDSPVSRIILRDVPLQSPSSLSITVDSLPQSAVPKRGRTIKKAFFVSPENTLGKPIEVEATAVADELWGCEDFNPSNRICYSGWRKLEDISPGISYSVDVSRNSAFAELSLVTVNTDKPEYHPGEHVTLFMAVLDTNGYLVDANMTLRIDSPSLSRIFLSTFEHTITRVKRGIYRAFIPSVQEEGNYSVHARAFTSKGIVDITSSFLVQDEYPFDIIRDAPLSIDPWRGPFKAKIRVVPLLASPENVVYSLRERLPLSFSVEDSGGAVIRKDSDAIHLIWRNLTGPTTLSYSVQTPLESPALWEMGRSDVDYTLNTSRVAFVEARPWLLAVDPSGPPTPHGVAGWIFHSDGSTQVELGTPFTINDTNSGDFLKSKTNVPVPGYSGRYSESIDGQDGDLVIITAWNNTHYGRVNITLEGDMDGINVSLNLTRPPEVNVTILNPPDGSTRNTSVIILVNSSIMAIGGSDSTGCNATITLNSTITSVIGSPTNSLGDISLGSSKYSNWNISAYKEGDVMINVSSRCSSDAENFDNLTYDFIIVSIVDTSPPLVVLSAPPNSSWHNTNNITFYYNVSDYSGVANCTILFDDNKNATDYSVNNNATNNFSLMNLPSGMHNWSVECYDNSSRKNKGASLEWRVGIDTDKPIVSLISPEDNYTSINNTVVFYYNVTDPTSSIQNCSLLINGSVRQVDSNITEGVPQNFTQYFEAGTYAWRVNCSDSANNQGSEIRSVIVIDPDFYINSSLIVFSDYSPQEQELIVVNATVMNLGGENGTDVVVQFFEHSLDTGSEEQIGGNVSLNVTALSEATASVNWTAAVGNYSIIVIVDPPIETNGSIHEMNESNNKANRSVAVPPWQYFYGRTVQSILLDIASNSTFYSWYNANDVVGNIYVMDTDSSINWSALLALGRNTSDMPSLHDFEKADSALNISSVFTNLNLSYTSNGVPIKTRNFTVFSRVIDNVPVINSTNTSAFVTGILWDSSDGSPAYNGSQDLVFIANINRSQQGKYGVYDYEVRIPASLRSYVKPDEEASVTIYTEIV